MAINQGQQNTFEPPIWKRKEINVGTLDRMYLSNSPNSNITNITNINGIEIPSYNISSMNIDNINTVLLKGSNNFYPLFYNRVTNSEGYNSISLYTADAVTTNMFSDGNKSLLPLGIVEVNIADLTIKPIYIGSSFQLQNVQPAIYTTLIQNSIVDLWYNEIPQILAGEAIPISYHYSVEPYTFQNGEGLQSLGFHWLLGRFQFLFLNNNNNMFFFKCIEHINKIYFRR